MPRSTHAQPPEPPPKTSRLPLRPPVTGFGCASWRNSEAFRAHPSWNLPPFHYPWKASPGHAGNQRPTTSPRSYRILREQLEPRAFATSPSEPGRWLAGSNLRWSPSRPPAPRIPRAERTPRAQPRNWVPAPVQSVVGQRFMQLPPSLLFAFSSSADEPLPMPRSFLKKGLEKDRTGVYYDLTIRFSAGVNIGGYS